MSARVRDVVLALVGLGGLALTSLAVDPVNVAALERSSFHALNGMPDALYRPLWPVMQLGNLLAAPAVGVVALAARRYRLAAACLLVTGGKMVVTRVVKDIVVRSRPAAIIDDVIRRDAPAAGQAFVSGHAVVAVALAVLVHPYLGARGRLVVWSLAALVCAARVYVGAHLPLDVVGGAFLGLALGSAVNALVGTPAAVEGSTGEVVPGG